MSNNTNDRPEFVTVESEVVDDTPAKTPWFKNPTILKIGGAFAGAAALVGAGYALNRGDKTDINVDGNLVIVSEEPEESEESTD